MHSRPEPPNRNDWAALSAARVVHGASDTVAPLLAPPAVTHCLGSEVGEMVPLLPLAMLSVKATV